MGSLTDEILLIRAAIDNAEKEILSLKSGRKASGARSRKSLMELKKLSHGLRSKITEYQREMPVKKRVSKTEESKDTGYIKPEEIAKLADEAVEPEPVKKVRKPRKANKPKV